MPNFYFGGEKMEEVKKYDHLGVKFTNTALFESAASNFYDKAKVVETSTLSLIKRTKLTAWNKIENLFESLISSLLL